MRTSAAALVCLLWAAGAVGQTVPVSPETRVRSVRFEVAGELRPPRAELARRVATWGSGRLVPLRRAVGWLPFVPQVSERRLDPLELQRDKERIRRFLAREGYPRAIVDYEVTPGEDPATVDVKFRIWPGPPLLVDSLTIAWTDTVDPGLDPGRILAGIRSSHDLRAGLPLDSSAIPPAATATVRWLGARGYPFAEVEPRVIVDTAAWTARVVLRTDPGPRARIGSVLTAGAVTQDPDALVGFSGVQPGDRFSLDRLEHAADRVSALDVVRRASFEVPRGQPADTLVDVLLRIREESLRVLAGEAGYASDGGLAGEVQWTHRNIFGGAQTFTATVAGQSGALALEDNPEKFVRTGLAIRQPIRGRASLTLDVGPFVAYRNDYRDRSLEYGLEATLLQRLGPLSSVALHYELSTRRVFEYRFGDFAGGVDFLELLVLDAQGVLDTLGTRLGTSTLSLSASLGTLDAPTEPTRGFVIEPSVIVAGPSALSAVEYTTADLRASGYLSVSRSLTLAARIGGGRVFPFGKSVPPSQDEGFLEYLRLRDVLFTAGGMDDVRGWGDRLLGPKFPQIVLVPADSVILFQANRYVPIGGFQRVHATAEARIQLPLMGAHWSAHTFVDAGRVWTRDERFTDPTDTYGIEKLFWALGGGLDFATPVGTLRFAAGYKMNPSILDLASPQDVTDALLRGDPLDELPRHPWRRLHLHFGLGTRL